jgi:hypothetical protein
MTGAYHKPVWNFLPTAGLTGRGAQSYDFAEMRVVLPALLALLAVSCSSAGPYGYSRTYSPLSEEDDAAETSKDFDPVMASREKSEWKKVTLSVFGIVKKRSEGKNGSAYVSLSVRTLADRNLCDDIAEETCRVTVSEREHASVHALLKLSSGDDIGEHSVGPGSLVRVIGKLTDDVDPNDGAPVLAATYYRHWPRNFFVTTADRAHMQR